MPVKDRCPHCASWLETELEDEGLAVVSAQTGQAEQAPYQEGGGLQADPILEDHARWRAGSIFGTLSGFLGLFVISVISYGDYASYGKAFFRQGNNVLFLSIAAGFCALLFFGSIVLFALVTRENKIYRQALLRRELGKSSQPSASPS